MKPAVAAGIDDQMMTPALYKSAVEGKHEDYYEALRQQTAADGGVGSRQVTPSGNTVLHVAALHGRKHFVEKILEDHEASMLLAGNNKNETVLHCAAERGYANIVSVIIAAAKKYEDLEPGVGVRGMIRMTDDVKDTALHKAVRMGNLKVVKLLVEEDPEFEYLPNDDGETPIYIAAELQFEECLVEMLNTCKNPTYGGTLGRNARHAAILSGFEQKVDLKKILNPFKRLSNEPVGPNALLPARQSDYTSKCIKPLLGSDISLCKETNDFGWTPLHYAVKNHNGEAAYMILERETSAPYIRAGNDVEWTTIFHIAAREGSLETMIDIEKNCPGCWEMINSKGQNVLHEVVRSNTVDVIDHIKRSNQLDYLVHQKDNDGNTPLHLLDTSNRDTIKRIINQCPTLNYLVFNKKHQTLFDMIAVEDKKQFLRCRKFARRSDPTENEKQNVEEIKSIIETSKTSIVVATLILTMTFAAGFAVPGGYNSEDGKPILLRKAAFKIFIVSDTISFLCSLCSIVSHIMMVRRASSSSKEDKIIRSLYTMQNMALFYSCVAVIVAFLSGMYAILAPLSELSVAVLVLGCFFSLQYLNIIPVANYIREL